MEDGLPVVGERCPAQRGSAIPAVEGGGDVRKGPGHGVWKTGCSGAPTRFMRASVSGRSRDWPGASDDDPEPGPPIADKYCPAS